MVRPCSRSASRRGFTLIETVISMGVLFVAGLATIAAIIYTRQSMEVNKQTITAMNYARQILEAVSTNSRADQTTDMIVMRFNDPGLNVPATVQHSYYPITDTGTVDWDNPTTGPLLSRPTYTRVVLSWNSMGATGRRRSVTMSSVVRAGFQ